MPDMTRDSQVQERCAQLVDEAHMLLTAIGGLADRNCIDPLIDPTTLGRGVRLGLLDAPQLRNNPIARGAVRTSIAGGACIAVDSQGRPLPEAERLRTLVEEAV
jgi:hypothetical protein